MTATLDPDTAETRARALLDARIASVRELVAARQKVLDLQTELADAERTHTAAYKTALRDGWTTDELKTIGLPDPDPKVRSKRTKPATT